MQAVPPSEAANDGRFGGDYGDAGRQYAPVANPSRLDAVSSAYSMARSGHDLPSEYDAYGSDRRGDEPPDILSRVDAQLAEHGLEVVIYDAFDEAVSWRIEKREER